MAVKLIISGLSQVDRDRFNALCGGVEAAIPEHARRGFDQSTVARLAVMRIVDAYEHSPEDLAALLGYQAS